MKYLKSRAVWTVLACFIGFSIGWILPDWNRLGSRTTSVEHRGDSCFERLETFIHTEQFRGWQTIGYDEVKCPSDD